MTGSVLKRKRNTVTSETDNDIEGMILIHSLASSEMLDLEGAAPFESRGMSGIPCLSR